jgi:prepilin-type N-terminal cleavage/methylation domain-containing protein
MAMDFRGYRKIEARQKECPCYLQSAASWNRHRDGQRGFTLVEILVVISIIGMLIGLLLPAVQQSREAARRAQCQSNLKNQVLALHSFHDAHRQFPPGSNERRDLYHSWCTYVLPYMEQGNVYNQINLNRPWYDAFGNYLATRAVLPVFRCPSSVLDSSGDTDYGGVRGSGATGAPFSTFFKNGVLIAVSDTSPDVVTFSSITDGASNTICIGESADRTEEEHGSWADGLNIFFSDGMVNVARGEFFSCHPGGVLTARADGSVVFMPSTTNEYVVGAACTRNGGEVVTVPGS